MKPEPPRNARAAQALGETPEDPLLLFSVLWGFWVANLAAFNGDVTAELARELLTLAEKQKARVPLMIAHRSNGISLLHTGEIAQCRPHFDRAIALYDPAEHRPLATRFGGDIGVTILAFCGYSAIQCPPKQTLRTHSATPAKRGMLSR
jgi:hypothetical protein